MTETKSFGVVYPSKQTEKTIRLQYLLSCRMRLDENQRNTLKAAWNSYREEHRQAAQPAIGGSSISTITNTAAPKLLGMTELVISDLIGTRDSLPLVTVVNLQDALGVEIVTKEDIKKQLDSYLNYVWSYGKDQQG